MRKDNVDLIWSISELSSLLERRTNTGQFLQDVVEVIADHLRSDVCSIYLYDEEADVLVLRATKGLAAESVGRVKLGLGEGITGQALKELRPIREAEAIKSPHFKAVPDIDEEQYESFLAVPIKRGMNRIGVMVLQHRQADYFDIHDTRAIQAIASHLAATLENIEILMEIHGQREPRRIAPEKGDLTVVHGKAVSEGIAMGTSVVFGDRMQQLARSGNIGKGSDGIERFRVALSETLRQLEVLQDEVQDDLEDVASLIFSSHLLMLNDEEFSGKMEDAIRGGVSVEDAVTEVVNQYVMLFSASGNARVEEKALDVKDLGHRLLRNLEGKDDDTGDYRGQIVVATELYPSELVRVALQHVEGLILQEGGMTAHISILARSFDIPVILTSESAIFSMKSGTPMLLDGYNGIIYCDPEPRLLERFKETLDASTAEVDSEKIPEHTHTMCGQRVYVMANINIVHDVKAALAARADGVGLYRSEFPFIVRNNFPSEEEQYQIYRKVVGAMGEREVVLRTLDVGGDKVLPHPRLAEANPFLGYRGIRFSLGNPDVFKEQLRAMLRAGVDSRLSIMVPMISSVDEYQSVRELVDECIGELSAEGIAHNGHPQLGAMIELPSAVETVAELSCTADFLSIGTNDLVMYTLGVDRTNDYVSGLYKHYHPAVLRSMQRILSGARKGTASVSICGNAATDPVLLPFLLGIGLRRFSVEPREIPRLKEHIGQLSVKEAEEQAARMLHIDTIREMEEFLGVHRAEQQ